MIKHTYILLTSIIVTISFYSCGTIRFPKTSGFAALQDASDINGEYLNRTFYANNYSNWNNYAVILSRLRIPDATKFETVSLSIESPEKLKVSYKNDSLEKTEYFEGETKGKYFEIYFSKKQKFIPLIYSSINVNRVRIGKKKDGSLHMCHLIDQSGSLLLFGAGSSSEDCFSFTNIKQIKGITPKEINGKWGYVDIAGNIQIEPTYDFACFFERGAARIKVNNKWGLIDKMGNEIIPIEYDYINPVDTLHVPAIFKVSKNGKHGVLGTSGEELIPVIYDKIDSHFGGMYTTMRLNDKYGIITRDKIIIPAIYNKIDYFWDQKYAEAIRNGNTYLVDKEGYEYEIKTKPSFKDIVKSFSYGGLSVPDESTKRKISFDEQFDDVDAD